MSELGDLGNSTVPQHERERMRELMSFEDYRRICDEANNFRKVGIQGSKAYEKVSHDARTIYVDYANKKVPLLAPIGFEKMYDEERCIEMTSKPNILLLSLPLSFVQNEGIESEVIIDSETAVIVEEFVDVNDHSSHRELPIPPFIANSVKSIEFIHPDLAATPGHETAWMAGYSFEFGSDQDEPHPCSSGYLGQAIADAWQDYCFDKDQPSLPHEGANETYLLSAQQLSKMPQVVEGLWAISAVGFGKKLGAHHPVAMEFNRDFFDQQIIAENTVTAVHYVDGQPVCFGFIGLDMSNNDWLNCNSDVVATDVEEARQAQRAYIHFHELISNGFEGMGYSTNILKTFLDIAARTRFDYTIFFESTNLSSTYIPYIIEKEVAANETLSMKSDIEMIGKLSYWAIVEDA